MKVYKVIINSDGETTRDPSGKVSTEIICTTMYIAADSIETVFDAALKRAMDGDIEAVIEVIPSLIIL